MKPRLIFVYNARKDKISKLKDFFHKIISPQTYACELCALTHGNFREKPEWKHFLESLDMQTTFYYIEDWKKSSAYFDIALPVIVLQKNPKITPEVIISKSDMKNMASLDDLIAKLKIKLKPNL
ncbi:MAG: hypothetical protein M3Q97_03105 [Bacteroidota bacterium]|nr:hypothetical protein [Bacteroidota bacterium]